MTSALIFALSMAGFGLLVFGERMGLGTQLASFGVAGIFVLVAVALALANMTSRLHRFMVGSGRGAGFGLTALIAGALVFGLQFGLPVPAHTFGPDQFLVPVFALLAGFIGALIFVPLSPWQGFGAAFVAEAGVNRKAADRKAIETATSTRGALPVLAIAVACLSGLLIVRYFPLAVDRIAETTGWQRQILFDVALASGATMALLGGLQALSRAALVLIVVAFMTAAVPAILLLTGGVLDQLGSEMVKRMAETTMADARLPELDAFRMQWPTMALGFVLGLAVFQPATPVRTPARRVAAIVAGIIAALGFGLLVRVGEHQLNDLIVNRIVAAPPSQWPVFVFDETIRGWLSACSAFPEDALAATRQCGTGHPRNVLSGASLRFESALGLPALALAQGWPIILGFIWALLIPLLGLVILAFFLHAAASGFSERVLFRLLHPRALRSWRLAIARLTLIAMTMALFSLESHGQRLDPTLYHWALLGLVGTVLAASTGYWLIAILRAFRARRA